MNRFTHDEMAFELGKLIYGKSEWLRRFSGGKDKRPDHDLETRRRERRVLEQARDDYTAAAKRSAA